MRTFGTGLAPAFPLSLPLALFFLGGMLQAAQSYGHSHLVGMAGRVLQQKVLLSAAISKVMTTGQSP